MIDLKKGTKEGGRFERVVRANTFSTRLRMKVSVNVKLPPSNFNTAHCVEFFFHGAKINP